MPKDKYNIFLSLFKFPLPTPSVVEDVYRELERVFYSRNSTSTYQFTDSALAEDWNFYKQYNLDEPNVWKTIGWQKMKTSVNSILIVDLPKEQVGPRPSPYFYWLDITNVIDYETKNGTDIEWIIFRQEGNKVAVFDDTYMRVLILDDKGSITGIESEIAHELKYCPARFFWTTGLKR